MERDQIYGGPQKQTNTSVAKQSRCAPMRLGHVVLFELKHLDSGSKLSKDKEDGTALKAYVRVFGRAVVFGNVPWRGLMLVACDFVS
jgi:hypothetical protein